MKNTKSENQYFGFMSSVINYSGTTPFEIVPGYTLCRASDEQIEKIKKNLTSLFIPSNQDSWHQLYETKIVIHNTESYSEQPLPKEEWNYWVVNMLTNDETIQLAFTVADVDLFIGAYFQDIGLSSITPGKFRAYYEDCLYDRHMYLKKPQIVTENDLKEVKFYYSLLQKLPQGTAHIKNAVEDLEKLRFLRDTFPLKYLGYVAILESVLTHPPKPTDPTDSIGRQIRSKLALVENRSSKKLQWSERFKGSKKNKVNKDTVISKLYTYRSKIAHGGQAEFTGELQLLKNQDYALKTIKDITKLVVQQALQEPELLTDLKKC